jgi:hypothetical protein
VLQPVQYRPVGLTATARTVYGDMRLERGRSKTANMCREAGYFRCSWLMCWASSCFFLCSKCHNARTQLQIYSRTAKRLTFLQKIRNCVHTVWCSHCGSVLYGPSVWCSHCGSVLYGPSRSHGVKHEACRSTAVGSSPIPPYFRSSEPQTQTPFSEAKATTFYSRTLYQLDTEDCSLVLPERRVVIFRQFGIIENRGTSGKFTTNQSRKSVQGCTELALQDWISHCQPAVTIC